MRGTRSSFVELVTQYLTTRQSWQNMLRSTTTKRAGLCVTNAESVVHLSRA